ncbi:Tor complex Tor2 interacting protein 1 [Dionaea muscipula]
MEDSGIGGGGGGVRGGDGEGGGGGRKRSDPFIDRSKVRILLCDNDTKSTVEVIELLCKCSYQVTSVRSARQVIDALNAEGAEIDVILTEVDLPLKKGMKMLKYITRDKELQRIPVIMMSAQDEVSIVVNCLRLGAADYLVKPLRTNELLNLWTHMWRRRQILGLAEKNILNYDFDLMVSDPSDANTNSTTLFSDDTEDKSWKSINPEMTLPTHQEDKRNNATLGPMHEDSLDRQPDMTEISRLQKGHFSSCPKSSAFCTYVKSSLFKANSHGVTSDENPAGSPTVDEIPKATGSPFRDNTVRREQQGEAQENNSPGDEFPSSTIFPDSTSIERSCTPPTSFEFLQSKSSDEGLSRVHMHHRTNGTEFFDIAGFAAQAAYPYYMPGVMNQGMLLSAEYYQNNNLQDQSHHATSAMVPNFNRLPHCSSSHVPGLTSFPYYHPVGMCLQPGQMPTTHHQWHTSGSSNSNETKSIKVDRREAALIKFRQKRLERCFDKKIRYVNRKRLAERRPRVRGQFVRKVNGVSVDLNGDPSADLDEDDIDPPPSRDSSPEDDAS